MSCTRIPGTFRLLDAFVGWDEVQGGAENLVGLDDPIGVRLQMLQPGAVNPLEVLAYMPPARLARGCRAGEWYLITKDRPSRLLRLDICAQDWKPIWSVPCDPRVLDNGVAIAVRNWRVAAADYSTHRVWAWRRAGEKLAASIEVERPVAVALAPWGEVLVAAKGAS